MLPLFLKCLLLLPPEFSHDLALTLIPWIFPVSRVERLRKKHLKCPVELAGLRLPNPVGLAAGLDKDGRCLDAWFGMGFGFIEVGTVTPKPQAGNPKPRLFRLKKFNALINRMGFNNDGVDALVERLKCRHALGVVGVNIGKNRDTPLEKSVEDYRLCFEKVYPYADYITVNISSPNTPGIRKLQGREYLDVLLGALSRLGKTLEVQHQRRTPIFVKIAPDLEKEEVINLLDSVLENKMDGVIATNTSFIREPVKAHRYANEAGGLSGAPIYPLVKTILKTCLEYLNGRLPVIALGGINSPEKAEELLKLGVSAVQIYTAFIYQGPPLIRRIIKRIKK